METTGKNEQTDHLFIEDNALSPPIVISELTAAYVVARWGSCKEEHDGWDVFILITMNIHTWESLDFLMQCILEYLFHQSYIKFEPSLANFPI